MKNILKFCCIMLLIILMLPVSARADVIYEPFDDFYMTNRDVCTYEGRGYLTAGPNGMVILYESPINSGVKKTYDNGTALYVSYIYQAEGGVQWACCDNWDDNITGWVPMEYLELIYDSESFAEEYGADFIPVQISLDTVELAGQTVYFWDYPGSENYIEVTLPGDYGPEFYESYTDASGRVWVHCGYFRGIKNKWVNLNEPTATYADMFPMPVETTTAETETIPPEHVEEIVPATGNLKLVVSVAVVAIVLITAALLVLLKKKIK